MRTEHRDGDIASHAIVIYAATLDVRSGRFSCSPFLYRNMFSSYWLCKYSDQTEDHNFYYYGRSHFHFTGRILTQWPEDVWTVEPSHSARTNHGHARKSRRWASLSRLNIQSAQDLRYVLNCNFISFGY